MKLLKTCCCSCGCSLRTGSLITGSISLIISTAVFFVIIWLKIGFTHYAEQQLLQIDSFPIKLLLAMLLALNAVVTSILLIIGAAKGWKRYLIPYSISTPFGITLSIPLMVFVLIEFSVNNRGPAVLVLLIMMLFVGGVALHIYLVRVVISHYYELDENENKSMIRVQTSKPWNSCHSTFPSVPEEV